MFPKIYYSYDVCWTFATFLYSLALVLGHCISHQLIGTIAAPTGKGGCQTGTQNELPFNVTVQKGNNLSVGNRLASLDFPHTAT